MPKKNRKSMFNSYAQQESLWKEVLHDLVIVAVLGFSNWRCSFDGEIVDESRGFRLIDDGIVAFFRSCFTTMKILSLMWVIGGCVSSSRVVVIRDLAHRLCLTAPCLEGQLGSHCYCWRGSCVVVLQIATWVSIVKIFPSW